MSKVNRVILADGEFHEVTCAVLEDGVTAPVLELLDLLDKKVWPDPSHDDYPDEYQATIKSRFLAEVQMLADEGEAVSFNFLREGIWELKVSTLRVTFYDTSGNGKYDPKNGTKIDTWDGRYRYELPDFDEFVRLGHYFGKDAKKTNPEEISAAIDVRKVDLAHDKY